MSWENIKALLGKTTRGGTAGKNKRKQEGLILSGRIFQTVKSNPDLTNEQIAAEIGCEAEEVKSTRKMFGI